MKLTRIEDDDLDPEFRAVIEEMVASNREKVARLRRLFGAAPKTGDVLPSTSSDR